MRTIFKHKHWIFIDIAFFISGIMLALSSKDMGYKPYFSGFSIGYHFLNSQEELLLPIIMIFFSDLFFNVEYLDGTFLSILLCGKSKKDWFIQKSVEFLSFVLTQVLIGFLLMIFAGALVFGRVFPENWSLLFPNMTIVQIVKNIIFSFFATYSRVVFFVSIGILSSVLFVGKLFLGSIISIGVLFAILNLALRFKNVKAVKIIVKHTIILRNINDLVISVLVVCFLFLISYFIVKKVKIENTGM